MGREVCNAHSARFAARSGCLLPGAYVAGKMKALSVQVQGTEPEEKPRMSGSAIDPPRSRRRLSARWILGLALFLIVPGALLLARHAYTARVQRKAVEAVEEMKGAAPYSHYPGEPTVPDWLFELLGEDYFRPVEMVDLSGSLVNDAGLARLKGLSRLYFLDLSRTPISDAGMVHLESFPNMSHLNLGQTPRRRRWPGSSPRAGPQGSYRSPSPPA